MPLIRKPGSACKGGSEKMYLESIQDIKILRINLTCSSQQGRRTKSRRFQLFDRYSVSQLNNILCLYFTFFHISFYLF